MFETRSNRGKRNGYAPLDSSGKVPLSKLPPIQSTIDTGSFAITSSNVFTGTQIITGSDTNVLAIGQLNFTAPASFDVRATANSDGHLSLTSDLQTQVGAVIDPFSPAATASIFGNSLIGIPFSEDPIAYIGLEKGVDSKIWLFNLSGSSNFPGDINVGYLGLNGQSSGSLNVANGNINVSGSVNISSSLIVSSTIVNNGTIDAVNSDLIIEGGYLILTSSDVPTNLTGSQGDKQGMVVIDNNFLYYCTNDYLPFTASVPGTPGFSVTASGTTHTYNAEPGTVWNNYGSNWLQVGPSQEGDGSSPSPEVGWYFVDDTGTIKQIISQNAWFGPATPYPNGTGWLCAVDSAWTYSEITNSTITLHESLPTVNLGGGNPPIEGSSGSGEIWKKTKLGESPNYPPSASGSWSIDPLTEVTELNPSKDIHLLDASGAGPGANFHWYLPNGVYDGQMVRFALKGDGDTNPTLIRIWMNQIRTYNGTIVSSTPWFPFWDDANGSARSLATAMFISGAWNIDTDYWDMV